MFQNYEYYIYNCIKGGGEGHVSFHMPGHKGAAGFASRFPCADMDITELSYSDNLHSPTGAIAKAQRDIAEIVGARASFITTDGSTSGVYALVYAAAKRGKKIIIARNSHRSVYNACRLLNVEPVIVQGDCRGGLMLPPEWQTVEKLLKEDEGISAVLLTSPDYYGNIAPLERYAKITKEHGRLLLVDGAHGVHLAFEEDRRGYCGAYADMWVDGAHKTLPALTQGAAVHVGSDGLIADAEEALGFFRTTSPSYPIMASVEYGYKYLANHPEVIREAKQAADWFKRGLKGYAFYPSDDWCKIVIDFKPSGIDSRLAAEFLERENLYTELADGRYMIVYLSPLTRKEQLQLLAEGLERAAKNAEIANTYREEAFVLPRAERAQGYLDAVNARGAYVPLEKAAGKICAENAGINPPCIPVVAAGEIYTDEIVSLLKNSRSAAFGVVDGRVKVLSP